MDNFGFLKVAAAVPHVRVADCDYNTERMAAMAEEAARRGVEIVAFPELGVTAYTCGDLLLQQTLLDGDCVRGLAGAGVLPMSFDRVCSLGSGFWIPVARKLEVIRVTAFVSADKTPTIPKIGNGEKACVRAPRASRGEALDGQRLKLVRGNHRASRRCVQAVVGFPHRIMGSLARD